MQLAVFALPVEQRTNSSGTTVTSKYPGRQEHGGEGRVPSAFAMTALASISVGIYTFASA